MIHQILMHIVNEMRFLSCLMFYCTFFCLLKKIEICKFSPYVYLHLYASHNTGQHISLKKGNTLLSCLRKIHLMMVYWPLNHR